MLYRKAKINEMFLNYKRTLVKNPGYGSCHLRQNKLQHFLHFNWQFFIIKILRGTLLPSLCGNNLNFKLISNYFSSSDLMCSTQQIFFFRGHTKRVVTLCMSPTDDSFLSGSLDKTIRLWDLRSPNCQGLMQLAGRPVAAFDPEGLIFAAGINSESVKLYDLRSFDKGPFSSFKLQSEFFFCQCLIRVDLSLGLNCCHLFDNQIIFSTAACFNQTFISFKLSKVCSVLEDIYNYMFVHFKLFIERIPSSVVFPHISSFFPLNCKIEQKCF